MSNQTDPGWRRLVPGALWSTALCLAGNCAPAEAVTYKVDIVVSGGAMAAPAAALAAARANPSATVLLVEPTDWLGGQATSQGVSAIDNAWHDPGAALMRNNPSLYYAADYLDWLNRMKNKPAEAPGTGLGPVGTCWVSREGYDPRTGAWALERMVAEQPNIVYVPMTVVKSVEAVPVTDSYGEGRVIKGLTLIQRTAKPGYTPFTKFLSQELEDWYTPTDSDDFTKQVHTVEPRDESKGLVVIDASETGDAIVLSGATYAVGRELTTEEHGEDGSLPAMDENGSQATVYPFCMTDGPTDPETSITAPWPDFAAYYADQDTNYFRLGSHTWQRVWTYRRLKASANIGNYDVVNQGDVSMQNWYPGNDYPYGSIYLTKAQAEAQASNWMGGLNTTHLAEAEKHAIAWYVWMKNHRPTAWDTRLARGSDPMNMMGTPHGLAKFPYIRCGRRLVGLENFRILNRDFVESPAGYTGGPSYRYFDSVGIGNYACDVHAQNNTTGISPTVERVAPFYIPYRALGSANVRNLLAGGKTMSASFITNSAYRLHPIEWAAGSAAGTAAALMVRDGKSNLDLLNLPALREMQSLVNQNSPISWAAYDAQQIPPKGGDLILNDHKPVAVGVPFRAEVYHFGSARARILRNGTPVGETTTRANGRLVLNNLTVDSAGTSTITAECYSTTGTLLETLTVVLDVKPAPPGGGQIVDDQDATSFSLSGSWNTGTAQPDRYGASYRFASGSGDPDAATCSATWALPIGKPGTYEVFIWYPAAYNRVTDSPFTVFFAGGTQSTLKRINQTADGGRCVTLGQYPFTGGTPLERVVLTNATSDADPAHYVLADAVGISPISLTPVSLSRFGTD